MTQKHFVEVEDGEKVAAVRHEADSSNWIFLCHGFGSNKEGSYVRRCEKLAENGWNAVRFDFRGNGESDGDFIESTLSTRIEDLRAVVDYFGPESCVVFGSSFGGKVAFHAINTDERVKGVIGKAPVTYNDIMDKFRSVVDAKDRFEYIDGKPIDQRFFDDFDTYSFDTVANNLNLPVLIFHGSADTTVHTENSIKAVEALDTDVTFYKLKDEKHSFTDDAEQHMVAATVSWLHNNF
jgi:pimeloyl-ACP methyl ester carboxylesterase